MPYKVGTSYLFRTVGFHWVGRVAEVLPGELVIDDATCVFDTGRFHLALKNGLESLGDSELEPVERPVILHRGAIVDACEYPHSLPRVAK